MTEAGVPPGARVYSLEEIAAMLAAQGRPLSLQALRDRCRDGSLGAEKRALGWRVAQADLDRFLAADTPAPEPRRAPGSPGTTDRAGSVRRALAELKIKLEEERRRRRDRLAREEDAEKASAGPPPDRTERAVDHAEEQPEQPELDPAAAAPTTKDPVPAATDEVADAADPDPGQEPAATSAEPCGFLAELEADEDLAAVAIPDGALEERDLEGRDLRLSCELARDETGELQRHGVYESWYGNGRQAARGAYERGRLEGPWQQWHDNGRLHCVGAHRDGLPDGPWTWWDEQGRKIQEVHYDRGRPDGLWSQFHHNGRTWCEGRYRAGLAVGNFRYWDSEGRPA